MSTPFQVESIFFTALDKKSAAERAAYLDQACGDAALRHRLEQLLEAYPRAADFLAKPAVEHTDSELFDTESEFTQFDSAAGAEPRSPSPIDWAEPTETLAPERSNDVESALNLLQPSMMPGSLGRLGHYEVFEVLGSGAFGTVVKALDEKLRRHVAIKLLSPILAKTSPPRKRFLREARSAAAVRHEHVIDIYAIEDEPIPYLVMEFIAGQTLQQKLDATGPLELADVLRIGHQTAAGLAASHSAGLIHRDIKPSNILLEGGAESVKLTDFGLARAADDASITRSGFVAGTPMYMAPEQALGLTVDQRADLFSLGSVLYVMTSGRPPFRAAGTLAVLKRVAEDTPRPIREIIPEVPEWLCDLIAKLHAKNPADRIDSAHAVADLLAQRISELQPRDATSAHALSTKSASNEPDRAPPRRPRRLWMLAAAVLTTLLIGTGVGEATGITDVGGTIIRLFSAEGTLVVEVDDPGVSVKIEGSDVVITGAGVKEIRLRPGRYAVEASKGGALVRRELVDVTKNGRRVVRVSHESQPIAAQAIAKAVDAAAWERSVSTLAAVERAKAVAIRLMELNPGFDGTITPTIEHGVVKGLEINIDHVVDISPIRALTGLTSLACLASDSSKGQLINGVRSTGYEQGRINIRSVGKSRFVDLSPVKDLPLTSLRLGNCDVYDLRPLNGMKLKLLHVGGTLVFDLSPLRGMPLEDLDFSFTKVSDISPLEGMKLTRVGFEATDVSDLTPLKGMALTCLTAGRNVTDLTPLTGMPLERIAFRESRVSDLSPLKGMRLIRLNCDGTLVSDISPLKGMPLNYLSLGTKVSDLTVLRGMRLIDLAILNTEVSDLSPLKGMPLERLQIQGSKTTDLTPLKDLPLTWFVCDFRPERDATILRAISRLKTINYKPAAEFWREVDEKTKQQ